MTGNIEKYFAIGGGTIGRYDVMGYMVTNPFRNVKESRDKLQSLDFTMYRFTLNVSTVEIEETDSLENIEIEEETELHEAEKYNSDLKESSPVKWQYSGWTYTKLIDEENTLLYTGYIPRGVFRMKTRVFYAPN